MLSIVHLIPDMAPSWHATQLRLLVAGLAREQISSQVIARTGPAHQLDGAKVTSLHSRRGFDLAAFRQLTRRIADARPDIVHIWGLDDLATARAAAARAGIKRIVVSTGNATGPRFGLARVFMKWTATKCQRLIVPCDAIRAEHVRAGLPATMLTCIPAGVGIPSGELSRQTLLSRLGLPSDAVLVAAAGRLVRGRRVNDLIWASDLLKFLRDDVHLLIFGQGPHQPRLERFRRLAQIDDRVHFVGDRVDLLTSLPHLAAFWSARETAGQPLALLEAMAAQVPVVASDVAGVRELLVPGESGFVFRLGDRAAIARHSRRLLDEPALARRVGEAGSRFIAEWFDVEAMVRRHIELYRDLS